MSLRIPVLAGTPQQFENFRFVFGDRFVSIDSLDRLREHNGGRQLVLLIGTWVSNPLAQEVLEWVHGKDRDGRPRGQCFVMMGRPK